MDAKAHRLLRFGAVLVLAFEAAYPRTPRPKPAAPAPLVVAPDAPRVAMVRLPIDVVAAR